jgi:hypothetical protein
VQLDSGPCEDPSEDDPAEIGEDGRGPRRLALAAKHQPQVHRAERDDGEGHRHRDRRPGGARLVGPKRQRAQREPDDHADDDEERCIGNSATPTVRPLIERRLS